MAFAEVAASPSSDDPKEKQERFVLSVLLHKSVPAQIEAACRKLWTAVHGSEKYIKADLHILLLVRSCFLTG